MYNIRLYRLLLLSLLFCRAANAGAENDIAIANAWISEAPPTVSILAGYLDIKNNSNKTMALTAASSPNFARIEIHRSISKGDMVSMEKQAALEILAGETIKLSPGDYHLMLFEPDKPMRSGEITTITFSFSDGSTQSIQTSVERRGNDEHHHHH